MRKSVAAAAVLVLVLSGSLSAEAAPPVAYPQATFDSLACPNEAPAADVELEGELSYALLGLDSVPAYARGAGVRIGVIDSGINPAHSTLQGKSLEQGVNLVTAGAAAADVYGSGTTFASVLVGNTEGTNAVRGVAPDATIVPIKIFDDVPNPTTPQYLSQVTGRLAAGINWAVENKIDIVVTPLALPEGTDALAAAVERAHQAGVLVIAPVGETSSEDGDPASDEEAYRYPAAYSSVLAVTAVDSTGVFSSSALISDAVDVAAPGQNVPGANNAAAGATCLLGLTNTLTMYAAVNAAGVAAILMSAQPDEDAATIIHRMETTAVRPESGRPGDTGWGIVNPSGAIHFIDGGTAQGPVSPKYGESEAERVNGRDLVVPEPDPQRVTKPIIYVGLAGGTALTLALLLGVAGLWKRQQS